MRLPDAMLLCDRCARMTRHRFARPETRRNVVDDVIESRAIWSCSVCATERVWGTAPPHGTWTTRDELAFLARLISRRDGMLLAGYREGLGHRRVWIGIDREAVVLATDEAVANA